MPGRFLDDVVDDQPKLGGRFLDDAAAEPQVGAATSPSVQAPETQPVPAASQAVEPVAPDDNELYTVARSLKRGTLSMVQGLEATGLSNVQKTNADLDAARSDLAAFDAEFPQPSNPFQAVEHTRQRNALAGRVAQLEGESATRTPQTAGLISNVGKLEQQIRSIPKSAAQKEFEGEHWFKAWAKNPVEITAGLIAESLPQMAPSVVAGFAAGPGAAAITAGASSYATESASSLVDSMRDQGVNIEDKQQVEDFFKDPEKVARAREYANKRGIPVALFDAATAGLGSTFLKGAEGQGVKAIVKATAAETALQMAGGAGGEATGQLVSKGEIDDPRSVFAEALAELPMGVVEARANIAGERKLQAEHAVRVKAAEMRDAGMPQAAAAVEATVAAADKQQDNEAVVGDGVDDPASEGIIPRDTPAPPVPTQEDVTPPADPVSDISTSNEVEKRNTVDIAGGAAPLEFTQREGAKENGDVLVNVKISSFDPVFQKDQGFYVGTDGEGAIEGRRERFEKFLETGQPIEAPEVNVDARGRVTFDDGRHRYSVLRDQGVETVPMSMSPESAENARKAGLLADSEQTTGGAVPTQEELTTLSDELPTQEDELTTLDTTTPDNEETSSVTEPPITAEPVATAPGAENSELATESGEQAGTEGSAPGAVEETSKGLTFIDEPDHDFENEPIVSFIMENGGLMSPKAARQKWGSEKFKRNRGEFEDRPRFGNPQHNRIFASGRLTPDEATQMLVDSGLLSHGSTVTDLWAALGWASQSAERLRKNRASQMRDAAAQQQRFDAWQKDISTQREQDNGYTFWDLRPGDVVRVGDTDVKVTGVNEDSVELDGGEKYGKQRLEGDQVLYGRRLDKNGKPERKRSDGSGTPPAGEEPESSGPEFNDGLIGLANARIDDERRKRGLPPRIEPLKRSFGTVWGEAMLIASRDPSAGARLVNQITLAPRPLEDWESALLLHEQVVRQHEFDTAIAAYNDASDEGTRTGAEERLNRARQDLVAYYDAEQRVGTESGRSLAARKMLVDETFTLAKMSAEMQAAQKGKPLTKEQQKTVAEQAARIAELEKAIAELQEKQEQATAQSLIDAITSEAKAEAKKGGTVTDFLKKQADAAMERIRARRGKLNVTFDPLNIAGLIDETIVGAYHIANGINKLAEWSAAMLRDVGDYIKPVLPQLFEQSQKYHDANDTLFNPKKKKQKTPSEIMKGFERAENEPLDPRLVFNLARAYVRGGMTGAENVIRAVHGDLLPHFEGLTEREVRDAFSGYGKVQYPSKAEDLTKLREYRNLSRLMSQLEDAQNRIPPKKSGPQRDKPSEAIRTLQKRVKAAIEAAGFATSDKDRLANSLDAVKTRLRNEIEELDAAIASKTKRPDNRSTLEYDDEAKELKAKRDEKQKQYDEIFPKAGITDDERIARAIKALDKSIADEMQMFQDGITKREKPDSKTPQTPEIRRRQALLDSLRETRRELEAQKNPGKTEEEIALDGAMKAAKKAIDRYDEMMRTGNLDPATPAPKYAPTAALEELWSLRQAMRDAVMELRKEAMPRTSMEERQRKATIKALEKSIADYDKRLLNNDFSARGKKVTRPETQRVSELRDIRDSMRKVYEELRKAQLPRRSEDEIRAARDKKALETRIAKLEEKVRNNDYTQAPKKPPVDYEERAALLLQYQKAKEQYLKGVFELQQKNRSTGKKIFDSVREGLNFSRAVLTSFDLSGALRQGGFIAFGNPLRTVKAFPAMIRAAISETNQKAIMEQLRDRENYKNGTYKMAKLYLSEEGVTSLSQMEEAYMSRLAKDPVPRWLEKASPKAAEMIRRINPISASERAYTTVLNIIRADAFDAMATTLARNSAPTPEEARAIANFVNVATGRGELGKAAPAAVGLNTFFFAPRYVVSRFQLALGQPLLGGNKRTRLLIAKEYAKYLIGVGTVIGLASLAQSDDDDPLEMDPTSPDFLKVRYGNTRIDPMSGLLQVTTFSAREADMLRRFATGSDEDKPKYGDGGEVLWRFLRTKLSPAFGTLVSAVAGKDVVGQEYTPEDALTGLVVPITFSDIGKLIEDQGLTKGTALWLLSLLGMGVQVYQPKDD